MSEIFSVKIELGDANEKGWRDLTVAPRGEATEEIPANFSQLTKVLSLIHISDLHICDAQSPARVEALDRFADPHHPLSEKISYVGTYRAQEILTTQTCESLVRTINNLAAGHLEIDAVVVTGDVTDNAQSNEMDWYHTILDGGLVTPDSGDRSEWTGVASTNPDRYSQWYWNPEGTPEGCEDDFPRSLYGFPTIKGLTEVIRQPFNATGISIPWFATHGNHDALLQGTVAPSEFLNDWAIGDQRINEFPVTPELAEFMESFSEIGPAAYPSPSIVDLESVSSDTSRSLNKKEDWIEHHLECGKFHGLTQENKEQKSKYWAHLIGEVCLISLDTVNEYGGWQGSLDEQQFLWLQETLKREDAKYFVILSHHPAATLFNLYSPDESEKRFGTQEVLDVLLAEPRVILWLAGHNHRHRIEKISAPGVRGFYHIETSSLIDWPQQGRYVEIFELEDEIYISTKVFDHQSTVDMQSAISDLSKIENLAGISRALAANDWQKRGAKVTGAYGTGEASDRDRFLKL